MPALTFFLVAAVRELTSVPSCKSRSGSCERSTRLLGRKDMVALQTYNGDFADICSAGCIRVLQLCIASAKWRAIAELFEQDRQGWVPAKPMPTSLPV